MYTQETTWAAILVAIVDRPHCTSVVSIDCPHPDLLIFAFIVTDDLSLSVIPCPSAPPPPPFVLWMQCYPLLGLQFAISIDVFVTHMRVLGF